MRLLLGGVPLGCDNIGDEAIIACVVKLIRGIIPDAELTVCTRDRENTSRLLSVGTAPLYGFSPNPMLMEFNSFIKQFDAFIWFGATGLSDYPDTTLTLLETAQKASVRTIVWSIGMDDEFNPAFFKVQGRKKALLSLLSIGRLNAVECYEAFLRKRVRRRIRHTISKCSLVAVRDPESAVELRKCGLDNVVISADTAILQETSPVSPLPAITGVRRIGFCISAQRQLAQKKQLMDLWSRLLQLPNTRLVLIPMNPKTDKPLMRSLASELHQAHLVETLDSIDPAVVQACAAQCRVVVSSRLHLLILASNAHVPVIGIERGSKIRNWLRNFNDTPAGTVANCDFESIYKRILEIFSSAPQLYSQKIATVMSSLHNRLDAATHSLKENLNATQHGNHICG